MSKQRIPAAVRRVVIERANSCCEYCQSQEAFATQSFSVEHIIPQSQAGGHSLDNLAFACQGCNGHKYTKTEAIDPATGSLVSFFNPRTQLWPDHFSWNDDYTLILGITPTGRATVIGLQLNRVSLQNLRRVLYLLGEHPPSQ